MSRAGAAPDPAMTQAVMQRLFAAVKRDDANDIQSAINAGIDIQEIRAGGGFTLLHVAANEDATNVVKLLLAVGMDPLAKSDDGVTPLDVAKLASHTAIVELMEGTAVPGGAGSSPDPQSTIDAFMKIIVNGVATDTTTDIQRAIDAGLGEAMRDWRGKKGETLLHLAAIAGSTNVVNLLLDDGHDPRAEVGTAKLTPATMARLQNHTAIAERLEMAASGASQGRTPQAESSVRGSATPEDQVKTAAALVVQDVKDNNVAGIRLALSKGLNIQNIHGPNDETLLHLAAELGHTGMVEVLLEAGVDPMVETTSGMTATEMAYAKGHFETGNVLQDAMKKVAAAAMDAFQHALARQQAQQEDQQNAPAITQAPPAPTEASNAPAVEKRVLGHDEKHLWGTEVDDLHGYWQPGRSRTMARLRKAFDTSKQQVAAERAAKEAQTSGSAPAAPQASGAPAPAAQPATTFPPLTPAQERFKSAIVNGDVEALREQVAGGFPINDQVFAGSAALHVAAADGKTHVVRALLALGADLNAQDQQGNTALLYAIGNRRTETAIHLAQIDGIDVNHQTPTRYTALHAAVQANVPMVVPYLLAKGADTTLTNRDGKTPLQFAEAVKRDDIVVALRNPPPRLSLAEESATERNNAEWNQALYDAIVKGDAEVVQALATPELVRGMNGRLGDDDGTTLMQHAIHSGNAAVVKHLLDVGSDPNELVTVQGADYTALEIANAQRASMASAACGEGDLAVVRSVVTGPDDPVLTMTNEDGGSLLHAAVAGENADVVRFLVELGGIDLETRMRLHLDEVGSDGPYTALDFARIIRNMEAVAVIEEACDAANGGKGIDGETSMVKTMRKPDGGLFVGVYNKFTGEKVHRTMAERVAAEVLAQHGEKPTPNAPVPKELDAFLSGVRDALRGNR